VTVCEASSSDADAIMNIEKTGISHPWIREDILSLINDDNKIALKAISEDGTITGYVGASYVLDEAEVGNICILPEYRGNGIGKILFDRLITDLKSRGVTRVFLEVEDTNTPAISLYEHLGFVRYNSRKDYYGNGKDALLYVLSIDPDNTEIT